MGATQSTANTATDSGSSSSVVSGGWACCSGRAGKTTTSASSPEAAAGGAGAGAAFGKESAPLPDHYYNNITTARALAAANLFDDNSDDLLVAPAAYPVTVTLRLRRGTVANGGGEVRVHILINDLRPFHYRTPNTSSTSLLPNGVGAGAAAAVSSVCDEQTTPEQETKQQVEFVEIDIRAPAEHEMTERRKQAEASAAILLSYLTQTWPNQKVLDGWVDTSYQPLPAPNQSDTKFKVECNLPFTPRQVIEALATFSPSVNRLKWDSAIQSYTDIEVIDEHTRIIAACTKAVNAGFASVESREFIDLSLCRQLTTDERKAIRDSRAANSEPIPSGEWWISTVRADDSSSSRPVSPSCVRATNYPNGVVVYPAPNNTSRVMLVVYNELQLGWKKSFLRTTMPSELKTMMTRLRNHLQSCYPSSVDTTSPSSSPLAPTPSIPDRAASPSIPVASPTAVSSTGNTASPAHKLP